MNWRSGMLKFKAGPKLKQLVEHAAKGPTWKGSDKPSLFLVHDQGVYLMSASTEDNPEKKGTKQKVLYAEGLDPSKNQYCWEDAREEVGGDDFGENIDLEVFKKAIKAKAKKVLIKVLENEFKVLLQF